MSTENQEPRAEDSALSTHHSVLFSIPNIRRFIAFRIGFNARFYYPVFTILFLDFGLTIEQFAILNAFWAASIVLFEVPSGALADVIGRKRLVVIAAGLMVIEIAVLTFAPRGDAALIFALFLVNRILSGIAEAAASGADEALAYDSLVAAGIPDEWGRVLERQMRLRSAVAVCAMVTGAAVYDPDVEHVGLLGHTRRCLGSATAERPDHAPVHLVEQSWIVLLGV